MQAGPRSRFSLFLLGAYGLVWVWAAIEPVSRSDWFLENLLVLATVPPLLVFHSRLGLSALSDALLFVFYSLHAVGSHWSYVQVPIPWEDWGFERNHYDRVIHLSFGLLCWFPGHQVLRRASSVGPALAALFTTSLLMTASAVYEILEWGTMEVVAPDLGHAFVGAQGDEFDGTKDMAFALLGGLVSASVTLLWERRRRGRRSEA